MKKEVFTLRDEELWLLPQKAIYWPARRALLLADTHFGKVGHFRKNGYGVPPGAAAKNLQRFEQLLLETRPLAVYFLGDLFHSEYNSEWEAFCTLRAKFAQSEFHLILGNHDILGASRYTRVGMLLHRQGLQLGPFWLSHQPAEAKQSTPGYALAGHLHPGLRLRGKGRQTLRLPCFWFGSRQGILPSFGEFTGLHEIELKSGEQVFVIVEGAVIEMN